MTVGLRMVLGVGLVAASCLTGFGQNDDALAQANQQGATPPSGSPAATTTLDGKQIPRPDPPFGGEIREKASESKAWWAPRVVPPKGAPNVLLIMTDDSGFGAPSTFGGVIPTPALDRIAKSGLRYTNFHSTSLCSPTRAALITGRNHHVAGFGVVGELTTGFPGYDSIILKANGTIGTILKENGYATSWFGKEHNTPSYQATQAGPFDQWPVGMGFEYFYGFVGGDANQWQPNLFRNTTPIYPFEGKPPGTWNLTTEMANEAIQYMRDLKAVAPEKPFLVYYVPGGTHAPHHPTEEWITKISDMKLFDGGWNKVRETIFANQKRLGIMPANAQLTAWPKELPEWGSLGVEEKKLFIRQMDVYAAYLAYTDHEIGRVIQAVEDMGQLDNTLIIYISGDNGASAEGMVNGTPNEFTTMNGIPVPVNAQYLWYPFWGSDKTFPHYAAPWAWAMSTPFKWVKQVASHFGGTAQGVAMSWPGHIQDMGGIRTQFHHVIDIAPTILEAAGIPQPETINGVAQRPMDGVSMAYTWDKPGANVPARRTTQYFEMLGNRAIYHEGWVACTTPATLPWELSSKPAPDVITGYKWELYNVAEDPTQSNDIAARMPDKLKELQDLFYAEAAKNNVLPMDNSTLARWNAPKPSLAGGRTEFTYAGAIDRHSHQRRSEHSEQGLHHHRRGHDPQGGRGRHDRHRRRALRRLWLVSKSRLQLVGQGGLLPERGLGMFGTRSIAGLARTEQELVRPENGHEQIHRVLRRASIGRGVHDSHREHWPRKTGVHPQPAQSQTDRLGRACPGCWTAHHRL